jgi:hypothetical protein
MTVPVVDADPLKPSALPTPDSYEFFSAWEKKCKWKNEVTVKRYDFMEIAEPTETNHTYGAHLVVLKLSAHTTHLITSTTLLPRLC